MQDAIPQHIPPRMNPCKSQAEVFSLNCAALYNQPITWTDQLDANSPKPSWSSDTADASADPAIRWGDNLWRHSTGPTEVANYHGHFVRVASLEAGNDVSAVFVVETAISLLFRQMLTTHRRSQTILMYYNLLQTMTNYSHLLVMINETQLWFQHIPLHCGWFCWMYGYQFSGFWHERFDHCLLVLWYTFFASRKPIRNIFLSYNWGTHSGWYNDFQCGKSSPSSAIIRCVGAIIWFRASALGQHDPFWGPHTQNGHQGNTALDQERRWGWGLV